MIEIGKYYKSKDTGLVVEATSQDVDGDFEGVVITGNKLYEKGYRCRDWYYRSFEPCEAPQETQPDTTPTKDTELRLKCLELAVSRNVDTIFDSEDIVQEAQNYYDWITQQPVIGKYTSDVKIEIDPKFYKPIN